MAFFWLIVNSLLIFLLVTCLLIFLVLIFYARWHYGSLEKCGLPVVHPHWLLGSNPKGHKMKAHQVDWERRLQFGPVYGVYDGRQPTVFVADPELIRLIQTRDFKHFRDHGNFMSDEHPVVAEIPDTLQGEKWRIIRSLLTPHFSLKKVRGMCGLIASLAEESVQNLLEEHPKQSLINLEFRKYITPLIFQVVAKIALGIQIQNPQDPGNPLVQILNDALGGDFIRFDWTWTFLNAFPILRKAAPGLPNGPLDSFTATVLEILKTAKCRDTGVKVVKEHDMVDSLVELCRKAQDDSNYKDLKITEITAAGQVFDFFLTSHESVRTALDLTAYHLAKYPEIQDRVEDEIRETLGLLGSGTVPPIGPQHFMDFEFPFLSGCILETLRLTPSFFRVDRRCTKDWESPEGFKVKKGMVVKIPLWALHRDPDYFDEPENFDPERWSSTRKELIHPYAFNSFGGGPRACITQRFTIQLISIILVQFLREFRIRGEDKNSQFLDHPGNPLFLTYDPINLIFEKRRL